MIQISDADLRTLIRKLPGLISLARPLATDTRTANDLRILSRLSRRLSRKLPH